MYGADPNDEALVLGTADTPYRAGMTKYDAHDVFIVDFSHAGVYMARLIYGTGTMADAIAAGQYSTIPFITPNLPVAQAGGIVEPIIIPRLNSSTKLWLQVKNATDNAYIDFLVGVHEYAI